VKIFIANVLAADMRVNI